MPELIAAELAPTVADRPPGPPPRPKLRRPERRADPGRWRDVIPPALAEQIADSDALEAHRELVERVEQATYKVIELEGAHAQAVEKDRAAETGFAQKGRKLPAPAGPDAEAALEQGRRELELLERELPASANAVFAEAHPHVGQALAELERQLGEPPTQVVNG